MFVLMSLHATALMVEVRVACVTFFICAHRAAPLSGFMSQGYGQYRSDVSVGMFVCCGGCLSPVVLMQVHQCQGCSSGHATLNTELDAVSCVRCCDNVIPARVRSSESRYVRGEVLSGDELELYALKVRGVSSRTNLKLVRMVDQRTHRLVIYSSMSKSVCDAKDDP